MKAVNDFVIVNKIKEGPKKVGGLILSEKVDVDNRYIKAHVVSVSDNFDFLQEGSLIWYDKHAGHEISYGDEAYHVIRIRDIVIVE